LNCPPWLPGVQVQRWFAVPADKALKFSLAEDWQLPEGAVVIHHYRAADAGRKPLETRFLVVGVRSCYGVSYRWEDGGEDAVWVEDLDGMALGDLGFWPLPVPEPYLAFPGASPAFMPYLSTRQLNRPGPGNPIRVWADEGLLEGVPGDTALAQMSRMVPYDAGHATVEDRVRSYLDVNCSACHRPGGSSRGKFDARFETALRGAGLIDGVLEAGDLGVAGARIVVPGNPDQSILYRRLANEDFFRMPPGKYHTNPAPILSALKEWIAAMNRSTF
jgi:hypothetical protein